MIKQVLAGAAIVVSAIGLAACSSGGPAQSNLGPFSISACKLGWGDGDAETFFASRSAAQNAASTLDNENSTPGFQASPASDFSITLTATAIVSTFTVAYYNSAGTEISTGTAYLTSGLSELTAGQTATFMDGEAPNGAATCQVIGSDSGNA